MIKKTQVVFSIFILCLFAGSLAFQGVAAAASWEEMVKQNINPVKITRDDKGVWFITGEESAPLYDVFEAMGYAVATDRLWQAETYRRSARGRLAEILGPSSLESDIFMRTVGYSDEELQAGFDALSQEEKNVINGYVAGFNRRIAEIKAFPGLRPFEFYALGSVLGIDFVPAEWTPLDILAWNATMLRNFDPEAFSQDQIGSMELYAYLSTVFPTDAQAMFEDLRWVNDPAALTYIPASPASAAISKAAAPRLLADRLPGLRAGASALADMHERVTENLKKINAFVKMGSYAWSVAGSKTESGLPTIYSGPQMGFSTPAICFEGSIQAGGLNVSGMSVAAVPGIIIGRTPHHAWSMQVANAHTTDYYLEDPSAVTLHRVETIYVAGAEPVTLPVYRSSHGPVVNPMPYDVTQVTALNPIISWKYSHWGYEFKGAKAMLEMARATNMDEFGAGVELVPVSQHFCYADVDGNIAYWMSGRDPARPMGDWRLPQGFYAALGLPIPPLEWDAAILNPRSTDRNTAQGFYGGWNNKDAATTLSGFNSANKQFGPYHRAHVVPEYLMSKEKFTFDELRNLALNIASTDSFDGGGNPWTFASGYFIAAINNDGMTGERQAALDLLAAWDGHFVDGGPSEWAFGENRADAWVLMDAWIREVIRLTFADELGDYFEAENTKLLFNTLLHGLAGAESSIVNNYNWFQNLSDATAPQTSDTIIATALDSTLATLGEQPWGVGARGVIQFEHAMLGVVHTMPFSSRSTFAHIVEIGPNGPTRVESMFPLGQSGNIMINSFVSPPAPIFDPNFFSMAPVYDTFAHRDFPTP